MKYNCCEFLLHQIAFYNDKVRPCCSFSIEKNNLFSDIYEGDLGGIEKYLLIRKKYIEMFKNGEKPPCYNGCTLYSNITSDNDSFKLNNLIISHRTYCSFSCIYCEPSTGDDKKRKEIINAKKIYDIKPILLELRNCNLIEKGCRFLICGGECSEYPKIELAWLLYYSISNDCSLLLLSSGVNYSNEIASILKINNSVLKISVDAGTKDVFYKIKRVDAYDKVWRNIERYISVTQKYKGTNSRVELKYIIIPGINDTITEVDAFIKKCKQAECKYVRIDVEHAWIAQNKYKKDTQESVSKIINYFFDKLYNDNEIKIDFEGVEKDWLWDFVKNKYQIGQIGD